MIFHRISVFDMTDHVQTNFISNQSSQVFRSRNTFSCKNSFLGLHFDIVLGFPSEHKFRVMLLSNFQFHLSSYSMPWNWNSCFLLCRSN